MNYKIVKIRLSHTQNKQNTVICLNNMKLSLLYQIVCVVFMLKLKYEPETLKCKTKILYLIYEALKYYGTAFGHKLTLSKSKKLVGGHVKILMMHFCSWFAVFAVFIF